MQKEFSKKQGNRYEYLRPVYTNSHEPLFMKTVHCHSAPSLGQHNALGDGGGATMGEGGVSKDTS